MASLRKIPTCKNWIACFRDADGRAIQKSTKIANSGTPKERAKAKRQAFALAQHFEELARGTLVTHAQIFSATNEVLRKTGRSEIVVPNVGTYLEGWLSRQKSNWTDATFAKCQKPIRDFITLVGGDKLMADVSVDDISKFRDMQIAEGLTRSTVRGLLKIVRMVFREAQRSGTIQVDPAVLVSVKRVFPHQRSAFELADIRAMMRVADGEWKIAIYLGVLTGLRLGDIVRLQRMDISPELSYLSVVPEKRKDGERAPLVVPFNRDLRAHLKKTCSHLEPHDWLMPNLYKIKVPGRNGLSRRFLKIVEQTGIPNPSSKRKNKSDPSPEGKNESDTSSKPKNESDRSRTFHGLTFHSLRHSFNSLLANAGVGQELRMKLMDHQSERVNDGYTHLHMRTLQEAVDALPSLEG